jgi:hypothetical protein
MRRSPHQRQHGHLYAVCGSLHEPGKPGLKFFVACETGMAWTYAKRALSFAKLTNDGDDEGALFLDRLPSQSEAEMIRRYLPCNRLAIRRRLQPT